MTSARSVPPALWAWREGHVDTAKDHFALRYGSAEQGGWDSWVPVARVGPPLAQVFTVEFIGAGEGPSANAMRRAAVEELDYYLVAKRERNPWLYAIYHCQTMANAYSLIHWSYYRGGIGMENTLGDVSTRPAQKAARTKKRKAAAAKAAATRKRRSAGSMAAKTRKRRAAAAKAAVTRKQRIAAKEGAGGRSARARQK